MAVTTKLNQVDSRWSSSLDVDGNLVITSRGSIAAVNLGYALLINDTADGLAASISGGVSLTSKLGDGTGVDILADNYTIKVGALKPAFSLTMSGGTGLYYVQGTLIRGKNLMLGNATDRSAFGASFNSNVSGAGAASANSTAFSLDGALTIISEFTGSVSSTARSAGSGANATGIFAFDFISYNTIGTAAQLTVTAVAGSVDSYQSANATGMMTNNGIVGGDFGARVTVTATSGTGANSDVGQSATAVGLESNSGMSLGAIKNSFTITAKGASTIGSGANASAISSRGDSAFWGFASNIMMTVSATGARSAAYGISTDGTLTVQESVAGTWNITAAANGDGEAEAAMISLSDAFRVYDNFAAAATVRASSTKGRSTGASALDVEEGGIYIAGRISGSITVEAKSTGANTSGNPSDSSAAGFFVGGQSEPDFVAGGGFAANFKLNVTAIGIDRAYALGMDGYDFSGQGALGGAWTVSATASGGGTASVAQAAGIDAYDVNFGLEAGNKLVLTVSATENGGAQAFSSVGATAFGIRGGNISIGELGLLKATAKSGRNAASEAKAIGILCDGGVDLALMSGMTITATGNYSAEAAGVYDEDGGNTLDVDYVSGAYAVTATAASGYARAIGFSADSTGFGSVQTGTSLTVKATGGTGGGAYAQAFGVTGNNFFAYGMPFALTVAAVSGKNDSTNTAMAWGVKAEAVDDGTGTMIEGEIIVDAIGAMNISATGVADVGASGLSGRYIVVGNLTGAWTVTAASSAGVAEAVGVTGDEYVWLGSSNALTVRATGGTFALENGSPVAGTASSAIAIGILGGLNGYLPKLTVSATSGKNAKTNDAYAWGVASGNSGLDVDAFNSLMNVTANAVDFAQAHGMNGSSINLFNLSGTWTVTAASSGGRAEAIGIFGSGDVSIEGAGAFTVRATGGTFALVNNVPVTGTDSSATATGIEGVFNGYLPALSVTATSGKNAETNNASAWGVRGDQSGSTQEVYGLRKATVTANAADHASAIGYEGVSGTDYDKHAESVSATSSKSSAEAVGYKASDFGVVLGGSFTVSAKGVTEAKASGFVGDSEILLMSDSAYVHKMTVSAVSTGEYSVANAIGARGDGLVDITDGLWADWSVTATSALGMAEATLLQGGYASSTIGGLNGTFAVSATGREGASVNGFNSQDLSLNSDYRTGNFSLTAAAKSSAGSANALGFRLTSLDWTGGYRDAVSVTADGCYDANATGFDISSGDLALSAMLSLTVTARATVGNAHADGIRHYDGELDIELDGAVNISATGGRINNWSYANATANGITGGSYDPAEVANVALLQAFNVTAKSGTGGTDAWGMTASAYAVSFMDTGVFTMAGQTKVAVKADAVGSANASGVQGTTVTADGGGGSLTVTAVSTESQADAAGIHSYDDLTVRGVMKLAVAATAGKTKNAETNYNNNAIAFGMVAGGWDLSGNPVPSSSDATLWSFDLDGTLNVSAKAVTGAANTTHPVSRDAAAAAFASETVRGYTLDSFTADVQANAGDGIARADGIRSTNTDASVIDFGMDGNWKISATSATGSAEAYGTSMAKNITIITSAKTQIQVIAQADGYASASGFHALDRVELTSFAGSLTVNATSRKSNAVASGIEAQSADVSLQGTIAVTASGIAQAVAVGIYGSGTITVDGALAAAVARDGSAYAIDSEASGQALNLTVTGAIYAGKNANAASVATQLLGLVKSGGSAASLLASIKSATGYYYAVLGSTEADNVTLTNNAISVGDINLGAGSDTLNVSATSQVIGNVTNVEKINISLDVAPGKAPIFTVRDDAGSLDSQLFATLENAQLGTYVLAQGSVGDIGSMTGVSLVVNNDTELFLGDAGSRLLSTGAYGRLSIVTSGNVSKLVLEVTFGALGTEQPGGEYTPPPAPAPGGSSSLDMPEDVPPAAGSSGLSFDGNDFQLYGTGAAALDLGAMDSFFAEEQGSDPFKKGLLAG